MIDLASLSLPILIGILLAGLALIIFGAEYLVDGASAIARRCKVSEFVIGLTIVGMGTSAPELVVSLVGAFEGNADIAVGNVVGSNIFNTLLILGVTALLMPIAITPGNRKVDIPMNIGVSLLVLGLGMTAALLHFGDNMLSRVDAAILLVLFLLYIWYSFAHGEKTESEAPGKTYPLWGAILMVLGGLAALIFGGRFFVDSATEIAHKIGISDKFIAITILAGGTSAPELATCIVAAVKKKGQLALGNIIGSNIFNLMLILGCAALVTPISFASLDLVDAALLVGSALLLGLSVLTGKKNSLDRWEGAVLVAAWIGYMAYLIYGLL